MPVGMGTELLVFVCRAEPSELMALSVAERMPVKSFPGEWICVTEGKVRREQCHLCHHSELCCPVSEAVTSAWGKTSSGTLTEFSL